MRKGRRAPSAAVSVLLGVSLGVAPPVLAGDRCRAGDGEPPAEEVARLVLIGTAAPAGTVVLFAHGFARGDLRPSDPVVIRKLDDGTPLPIQVNAIARGPDGSVKVALLAVEAPAIAPDAEIEVVLARGRASPHLGAPLDLRTILRGRRATIAILPRAGRRGSSTSWEPSGTETDGTPLLSRSPRAWKRRSPPQPSAA